MHERFAIAVHDSGYLSPDEFNRLCAENLPVEAYHIYNTEEEAEAVRVTFPVVLRTISFVYAMRYTV